MYTYEVMIIRFMHVCSNSNFDLFGMEQNALHNKGKIKPNNQIFLKERQHALIGAT